MGISMGVLEQVIKEQREMRLPRDLIKRSVMEKLRRYLSLPEITVITGLRRVGKSTLLQQLRSESLESDYYINFDDDRLFQFALEDFQTLLELFITLYGVQKTFFFDEIQNIEGWETFVRRLHDQGNKIYITGSNATLFSQELGTRLTGRYIQVELYPYSFAELLHHKQPDIERPVTTEERGLSARGFAEYCLTGGIPIYVDSLEVGVLQSLYESVLYRDIISRYKLTSDRPIKELVYYFASNVGKEFSYNGLAKMIGLGSPTTVSDYCHYLHMSYLCYTVSRFSHSLAKQQHYNKKCYFIDHTMARVLGFRSTEDKGRLLENLIYIELRRRGGEIYFHKERKECDFLVRKQGVVCEAYQVCVDLHNITTKERELQGLVEAMQLYALSQGIIITENQEEILQISADNRVLQIVIIPAWKWAIS
ncbi:MAG: ATP-binding protein [Chlamydiae bacterium]|nr:ATP-binding protein [Chlamydiota bacterium]